MGGGGPGGGRLKQEPMDTDNPSDTDSLNRYGPQDADSLPGARSTLPKSPRRATVTKPTDSPKPTFRHPSQVADRGPRSENRRKSDSAKSEYEVNQLSVSVSRGPLSENQNRPKKDSGMKPPKDGRPIQPNVSITPIGDSNVADDSSNHTVPTTGIEIIPLGGKPITTGGMTISSVKLKAKARDLKRSLSEDDKRRLQKKEKKRRDEKQRQSLSSHRTENCGRPQSESLSHKSDHLKTDKDGSSVTKITLTTDPKAKLAGVIERLAYQTGDAVAIELKPASSLREKSGAEPNVEITLDRLKSKPDEKDDDFALKPKLKLTIKTPTKHSESGSREKKGDSIGKLFDDMVSPKLDKTFQIPKLSKVDSPTFRKEKSSFSSKSPSTSPKHSSSKSSHSKSSHSKINERFITDPSAMNTKRSEERKRSSDRDRDSPHFKSRHDSEGYKSGGSQASVSMHIVKSPAPTIHVQRCDLVTFQPLVHQHWKSSLLV